jgi:hypothetical protein
MTLAVSAITEAIREHRPDLMIAFRPEELNDHIQVFLHRLDLLSSVGHLGTGGVEEEEKPL